VAELGGFLPPVVIEILAKSGEAIAEFQKVNTELTVMAERANVTSASMSKMEIAAERAGAAFKAIAFVGVAAMALSVKEFMNAEEATQRLDTAMGNLGLASEANKKIVEGQITALRSLGFDTVETSRAMGTLVTATGSVEKSTALMTTAANLARYKHIDLNTAATILARGTQGSAKAFKELGVTLDSNLPKHDAINKAFGQLNQKLGGQASAYAKTFAGQLKVIEAQIKAVAEKLGQTLLPIIQTVLNFFIKFGKEIAIVGGAFVAGVVAIKLYTTAMNIFKAAQIVYIAVTSGTAAAQTALTFATNGGTAATKSMTAAQLLLNIAMKASPIGIVLTIVGLLITGLLLVARHSNTVRNAIIDVGIFGVKAIAWLIETVGHLVTSFMKFATGPLRLVLGALAALGVGPAKTALKEINGVIDSVGGFFEKTASKVEGFTKKLEAMKKTADETKKKAPKTKDATTDVAGDVSGATSTVKQTLTDIANLQITYREEAKKAYAAFDNTIMDATVKRLKDENDIKAQFNADKLALDKDYAQKYQDIINQSIDEMRNAFSQATAGDVGSLFSNLLGGQNQANITNLIGQFKTKIQGAQTLIADAGKLQGLGFSQQFIDQVIAQGTNTGHLLAQAIETSSPETISQLQSVYTQLDTVSSHGIDALATTMNDGVNFANEKLKNSYLKTQTDYQDALKKLNETTSAKMTDAQNAYNEAVRNAHQTLATALTNAGDALNIALDKIMATADGKLAAVKKAVADARAIAEGQVAASQNYVGGNAYVPAVIQSAVLSPELGAGIAAKSVIINQTNNTNANPHDIAAATAFAVVTSADTLFGPRSTLSSYTRNMMGV